MLATGPVRSCSRPSASSRLVGQSGSERPQGTEILDATVSGLFFSVLRVVPGGRCLECKHPHDPDYDLKQRAVRWGAELRTIRDWTTEDKHVTGDMIARFAQTQNRDPAD